MFHSRQCFIGPVVLFVFHEAMKLRGKSWPVISKNVQERCLTRISGRVRFIDGLTPELQTRAISDAIGNHPVQQLPAYVFEKFKENGLLGIVTEPEKILMLAALNLVECIVETTPRAKTEAAATGLKVHRRGMACSEGTRFGFDRYRVAR